MPTAMDVRDTNSLRAWGGQLPREPGGELVLTGVDVPQEPSRSETRPAA